MIVSPRDSRQYQENTRTEITAQQYIDRFYVDRGYTVDRSVACIGFDCILRSGARTYKVEEKFRTSDFGDFAVEMTQCLVTRQSGWFYETTCTHLNYVILDDIQVPTHCYIVNWKKFKSWFLGDWLPHNKRQTVVISPKGNGLTENYTIRWSDIPPSLWSRWDFTF